MSIGKQVSVVVAGLVLLCGAQEGWAAPAAGATAEQTTPVYYRLVLENSMFSGGNPKDGREIVLDLERDGEMWGEVYGFSRNYNMAMHKGAIKEAKITPQGMTLKLATDIIPDKFIPGGAGEYTVTLTFPTPDTMAGSFKGKFNGVDVFGPAKGLVYAPKRAADFVPLKPQEHPRLLLRKSDLPALREKMKTPFGKEAMAKLDAHNTPAALGLLYQLTGEKSWAEKAQKEAEEYLAGRKPPSSPFVPQMAMWGRLEELALVYDLCYDTLSDDFKARYRAWISDWMFQVYFAPEGLGGNWHVTSNHTANVYSGITLSGLVLFDEPSAAPAPPSAPFLGETLPPAKDFKPAAGVPVVKFVPGKSPTEWLHTEVLRRVTPNDPREVFYGLEKINPNHGTGVKVGDFMLTFEKQKPEEASTAEFGGLTVAHILTDGDARGKLKEPFTMVLYTVLEVAEPGKYVVANPSTRANLSQLSLAGKLLADGQVVQLEKGLYPLMCMVQWRIKWGHISPRLMPVDQAAIDAWAKKAEQVKSQHQTRLQAFETVLANWKRSAGGDPAFARMLRLGHFTSWLHCTDSVGKGGFQGEVGHYSEDASSGHAKLWSCWKRAMGFDLSPDMEYPDVPVRKLFGGPQDINGTTTMNQYHVWMFPWVREEWKPEMLGVWNSMAGVTANSYGKLFEGDTVRVFLNYPLDMKPAPLGTKLPLTWEAPTMGYYAVRSGWDKDAFIGQVFLKSIPIIGWNGANAGTYRLRGLGQDWACGTDDRVRRRDQENIVIVPELELTNGACGHLTYFKAGGDRTMSMSMDLNEVYESEGLYGYSKYGQVRTRRELPGKDGKLPDPSGITVTRAIAFDFSGASGAPCLYAVVDKIDGAADKKRVWLFQPPAKGSGTAITFPVKPADKGFVVAPETAKATLRGTFAYPATVEVSTEPTSYTYVKSWGSGRGQTITVPVHAVRVTAKDHFFFVGTVTSGEQPAVQVDGSGLNVTVTVGKRTIKFDGGKIVFGMK